MSQSVTFTPFTTPITAISYFYLFKTEKCEKCLNISKRFITDSVFLRKKDSIIRVSSVDKFLLKNLKTFNI